MGRLLLALALLVGLGLPASAAREFNTATLTCERANAIVQSRGSIVMNIGPEGYDRFVASRGFCDRDQLLRMRPVLTVDSPQCEIRWVCYRPKRGNN